MMKETRLRSVLKTLTYRLLCIAGCFILLFLLTGAPYLALYLSVGVEAFYTAVYYLHERAWDRTDWGRKIEGGSLIRRPRIKRWSQDAWLGLFMHENFELTPYEIAKLLGKNRREWPQELKDHIMQSRLWKDERLGV